MSCKGLSKGGLSRGFVLIGVTVGLSLVLTGCFGGEDDVGPTSDTTSAEETTTPTPTPPPTQPATTATSQVITIDVPSTPPPTDSTPTPTATTAAREIDTGPLVYTVEQGDTLYSIARKFEVSVDDLIATNNLTNPDVIFAGDTLVIPPPG